MLFAPRLIHGSPLIDPTLITKSQFDSIPDIHSQDDLPAATVEEIGKLFREYEVLDTFGLHLLHRHFPLEPGQIPVTTVLNDIVELTKLTPIDEVLQETTEGKLRGQLWFLNDGNKFQAYEYEYGPEIEFPQDFLQAFADYICVNNLQNKVALATSPSSASTMEYELGTTATVTIHRVPQGEGNSRIVGWSFKDVKGILEVNNPDSYQQTVKGPHKVLYLVGGCTALHPDGPFPFAECDVIKTLREHSII